MSVDKNRNDRPFAYPKPTETDEQLKNQPEFVDQQPNRSDDEESDGNPASNDLGLLKKKKKKNKFSCYKFVQQHHGIFPL
jgi:hypothetical protein